MAKTKSRKNARVKNSDTLKMLKDLPTCRVVLHNIALDKDLVQLHQLPFPKRRKEKLKHSSSCINATKNTSNVWMLKKDNTVKTRVTRSMRKLSEMKSKECKNLKSLNDVSYDRCPKIIQSGFVARKQQLECDTSVKSFSSRSIDETSTTSSIICTQKKMLLRNNKRPRVRRKLYSDTSGNI